MTDHDAFSEGQALTERHRDDLDRLREDVRAIIRDEVSQAGMSESDLERLVGRLVEKRMAAQATRPPVWTTPLGMGALLVVGAVLGVIGNGLITGMRADTSESDPVAVESIDPVPVESEPPAVPAPALGPAQLAAVFDSLFEARDEAFTPLISELAGAAIAAPVAEAIAAWNGGAVLTAGQRRRLHDAMVQRVVGQLSGVGLSLDGLVTRGPCSGSSCGALLTLWQSRGAELGLPPYPADAAIDSESLGQVERVIILSRMEGWDG